MGTITTKDGTEIFYKDWGSGQPVVFSHGWPLNADAWDDQLIFVAAHGYRAIAHDRRGHGRSSQPWNGNDMDTYADDLADADRDPRPARRGPGRPLHRRRRGHPLHRPPRHLAASPRPCCVGAIPPLMLKTDANPGGLPIEVFDGIRAGVARRPLAVLQGPQRALLRRQPARRQRLAGRCATAFWLMAMQVGVKGAYDCIKAFSETDLTEDLKKFDVPTLIIHGDDDQIVPIGAAALQSVEARQGRHPEDLPRRAARPHHDPQGRVQRRPAELPQVLNRGTHRGGTHTADSPPGCRRGHQAAVNLGRQCGTLAGRPKAPPPNDARISAKLPATRRIASSHGYRRRPSSARSKSAERSRRPLSYVL